MMSRTTVSKTLSRRQLVAGGIAVGVTSASLSAGVSMQEHVHSDPKNEALADAALHCVKTGQDCLEHCYDQFAAGDTTLAACASSIQDLITACSALARLAAHDSPHLAEFATVTAKICADCEAECKKHDHHMACAVCAESCRACIEEIAKLG